MNNYYKLDFSMLNVHGKFICVGLPDNELPPIDSFVFLKNGCFFGGSHLGSKKECLQMLQLAADKQIKPWLVNQKTRPSI